MRKSLLTSFLLLTAIGSLHAEEFRFELNRYGWLEFVTGQSGSVRMVQADKAGNLDVVFQSALTAEDSSRFLTQRGTVFTLEKLGKVVRGHPEDRFNTNSGDWKLSLSGTGKEFTNVLARLNEMLVWQDKEVNSIYGRLNP